MANGKTVACPYCSHKVSPDGVLNHFQNAHKVLFQQKPEEMKKEAALLKKKAVSDPGTQNVQCPVCMDVLQRRSLARHFANRHPGRAASDNLPETRKRPSGTSANIITSMKTIKPG